MPERLKFDLGFGRSSRPREAGDPMRLLVLGDFRGSAAAERPPLASRPTQQVDLDTLDDVMRRCGPRLQCAGRRDRLQRRSTTFTRIGCTRGSICSRRSERSEPTRRRTIDDLFGRLLGKPPQSIRSRPHPRR